VNARLDAMLAARAATRREFRACVVLALALHLALASALPRQRAMTAPLALVSEIELSEPPEPLPASEPLPVTLPAPAPFKPAAARVHVAHPRERVQPAPPSPAPAGPLLTAAPTAPAVEEPVRFVSDANGHGYASGIVGRASAHQPAAARIAPAAVRAPDVVTPESELARAPSLIGGDGCRSEFPQQTSADVGQVRAIAIIGAGGELTRVEVEYESPRAQGFGAAARACLSHQQFGPALDKHGRPTRARLRVTLHFAR
jgi:hypothetical protein